MPRLRVDPATTDAELATALLNLSAAARLISAQLDDCQTRAKRHVTGIAYDQIHVEINRLVTILEYRRSRQHA